MGGYFKQNGIFADIDDVTLKTSAAHGATFQTAAVEVGDRGVLRLKLDVTAASGGSPTLDAVVETSFDASTWRSLGSFAQKTGVANERKSFAGCDRFARLNCTIGGSTPSFTFSCAGEAV